MRANQAQDRKMQMFIRAMTDGVISERDKLLNYTVGEFYNEMSLFIDEMAIKKKALDKIKT